MQSRNNTSINNVNQREARDSSIAGSNKKIINSNYMTPKYLEKQLEEVKSSITAPNQSTEYVVYEKAPDLWDEAYPDDKIYTRPEDGKKFCIVDGIYYAIY